MDKSFSAPAPTLSANHGRDRSSTDKKAPGKSDQTTPGGSLFINMALTMSWQLAVVVLIPILAGVKLDNVFGTGYICTFVGLGLALIGSIVVMWRALQTANRLPVPKLTAAQKRAIKKAYEEEDKEE